MGWVLPGQTVDPYADPPVGLENIVVIPGSALGAMVEQNNSSVSITTPPPRIVQVQADVAAGNLTFRWEGEGPRFQVEKAATVNGQFLPVGSVQTERTFTDPGVLKTNAQTFYRVHQP